MIGPVAACTRGPPENGIVDGTVIPPERMACSVWLTDQPRSVTPSSGTKSVNPAGGTTPVRTQTHRIVFPVAASSNEFVTNASERIPGCGNSTSTTRWKRLLCTWFSSEWKTLRIAL